MSLATKAEQSADQTRSLRNFANLSLPGLREQVAQMLSLIGREGIFSAYTRHDISHIDTMLKMLDWLVPESTQGIMTPVDWLLTVLSIYLHDLGMLVTADEFKNRGDNAEFVAWLNGLDRTTEGREYVARTRRMDADEKERFYYQEYVRKGHAQRIREWITGRHSRNWGPQVTPIHQEIQRLLSATPSRFREYLGLVCESHHRSDLDKTDRYPVVARLGNDSQEVANVQYAAILLRTTDLLHVTSDRTPSVEYEAIRFSDPKSVTEWDKQLGTFSVGMRGRKLVETEPDSAIIVINADFTEEQPLFALQEYISYADSEIRQSKRWADKTAATSDGEGYRFPWHKVQGDVWLEGVAPQSLRFELDRGRLLDLLVGHTIYNEPTVAIRELLQNAIDAVRYRHYAEKRQARDNGLEAPSIGEVNVRWDPEDRILLVEDAGTGMDRDIIDHHLMSVGSSYYNTAQFEAENRDFTPISRFGIGILTCFMVSDDIEIITVKGGKGHRIRMTSVKSTYLLRELALGDPLLDGLEPHGTRVRLRLRDTVDLSKRNVESILRYWLILPECPVYYSESDRDRKRVGFTSPSEAITSFYPDRPNQRDLRFARSRECVTKASRPEDPGSGGAVFELVFVVEKGFYPERSFATSLLDAEVPKVCIEGIRVSDRLPGFGVRGNVDALLCVRNSKAFRTTVSRSGLEIDEGYQRAARVCADLLAEHVSDEVRRIENKPGRPLSQAATAFRTLRNQLVQDLENLDTEEHLYSRLNAQPSVVIETVEMAPGRVSTSRRLVSRQDITEMPSFWTVESRAVDSLGMISRDLGRELSLNEFLLALAPEVTRLRYSPLMPDAHWQGTDWQEHHEPERVEFSREHQQSAVRWSRSRQGPPQMFRLWPFRTDEGWKTFSTAREIAQHKFHTLLSLDLFMHCCQLSGDDSRTEVVASRLATSIQTGARPLSVWQSICQTVADLVDKQGENRLMAAALLLGHAFSESIKFRGANNYGDTPERVLG